MHISIVNSPYKDLGNIIHIRLFGQHSAGTSDSILSSHNETTTTTRYAMQCNAIQPNHATPFPFPNHPKKKTPFETPNTVTPPSIINTSKTLQHKPRFSHLTSTCSPPILPLRLPHLPNLILDLLINLPMFLPHLRHLPHSNRTAHHLADAAKSEFARFGRCGDD